MTWKNSLLGRSQAKSPPDLLSLGLKSLAHHNPRTPSAVPGLIAHACLPILDVDLQKRFRSHMNYPGNYNDDM